MKSKKLGTFAMVKRLALPGAIITLGVLVADYYLGIVPRLLALLPAKKV